MSYILQNLMLITLITQTVDRGESDEIQDIIDSSPRSNIAARTALPYQASGLQAKESEADLNHKIWVFEHRQAIYEWQHFAGKIVFFVSILIVTAGLCMSWIQFKKDILPTTNDERLSTICSDPWTGVPAIIPQSDLLGQSKKPRGASHPMHQIEVGLSTAKVSTSVIGLIVLTLSLAFFYLYLQFVFPIT